MIIATSSSGSSRVRPRVTLGRPADEAEVTHEVADDWAVIIPGGTWHNVINTGSVGAAALLPLRPARAPRTARCTGPRPTPRAAEPMNALSSSKEPELARRRPGRRPGPAGRRTGHAARGPRPRPDVRAVVGPAAARRPGGDRRRPPRVLRGRRAGGDHRVLPGVVAELDRGAASGWPGRPAPGCADDRDRWVAAPSVPTAPRWPTARSTAATTGCRSPSCGPGTGRGSGAGRGRRRRARHGDRAVPGRGRGAARRAGRHRASGWLSLTCAGGPHPGRRAASRRPSTWPGTSTRSSRSASTARPAEVRRAGPPPPRPRQARCGIPEQRRDAGTPSAAAGPAPADSAPSAACDWVGGRRPPGRRLLPRHARRHPHALGESAHAIACADPPEVRRSPGEAVVAECQWLVQ